MRKTINTKGPKKYKETKAAKALELMIHHEPNHADDDEITASSFPFAELIPSWSTFDPNTKNPATGSKFSSTHHGSAGGKKLSDFKNFHFACCLEFIDKTIAEATYRVRCMNVFTVDSNQCTEHRKTLCKDGPNRIYTCMKRNETATWGMIKDTKPVEEGKETSPWLQGDRGSAEERAGNMTKCDIEAAARRATLDEKLRNNNPNQRRTCKAGGCSRSTWRLTKVGRN